MTSIYDSHAMTQARNVLDVFSYTVIINKPNAKRNMQCNEKSLYYLKIRYRKAQETATRQAGHQA